MYTVHLKVHGLKDLPKLVDHVTKTVEKNIPILAHIVRDIMRAKAIGRRVPGTGKLANAIRRQKIKGGFGVGNMNRMSRSVPYWYVVDTGMLFTTGSPYVPPATTGYFGGGNPPSPGGSGERFTHDGSGFSLIPKKPIEPLGYTNAALAYIGAGNYSVAKNILLKGLKFKKS